jgi:hypothetical protein
MSEDRLSLGKAHEQAHEEEVRLTASDERFIEMMQSQLDPGKRTAAQRAAFRAHLVERLEHRSGFCWQPLVLTASGAVGGLTLWLAVPEAQRADSSSQTTPIAAESRGLLAYAYYETDYLANADGPGDFLSEEYQAIAAAFDVP